MLLMIYRSNLANMYEFGFGSHGCCFSRSKLVSIIGIRLPPQSVVLFNLEISVPRWCSQIDREAFFLVGDRETFEVDGKRLLGEGILRWDPICQSWVAFLWRKRGVKPIKSYRCLGVLFYAVGSFAGSK